MDERAPWAVAWEGDTGGVLRLLDQTQLPAVVRCIDCRDVDTVLEAIVTLRVRGAPALGVAAAYAMVLGARAAVAADRDAAVARTGARLRASRPTAVNLGWAVQRMARSWALWAGAEPGGRLEALLAEARAIHAEDQAMCAAMGAHGAALLPDGARVLTHCNAGALATGGIGTALATIYAAWDSGKRLEVFADETRPLLQGARLTAWELVRRGIPVTVLCDGMAASLMAQGRLDAVITGADRIARNGDVANKIGTYGVALAARAHDLPFYVAAPSSTFDLTLATGAGIPIEQRDPREVTHLGDRRVVPEGAAVYNPAFDVTPAALVTALVTERGLVRPVTEASIVSLLGDGAAA